MGNDKKSSRSFDLDKGGKRSFDLEKKPTRSFDLTKEEATTNTPPSTSQANAHNSANTAHTSSTPLNGNGDEGASKKKWLWIVLAIVILAILAYMLIPHGRTITPSPVEDSTEVVSGDSTTTEPADSVLTDSTAAATNPTESTIENKSESAPNTETQPTTTQSANTPSASTHPENTDNTAISDPSNAPTLTGNIEDQANQVIRGVYGNNPERRQKLGAEYKAIQKRVNELMRQ